MKRILVLILFFITLQAQDYIYFMPKDGKIAQKKVAYLFKTAHESIKIAIYTFTNKEFFKALKSAARRGVKIQIIADYESNKNSLHYSVIPQLKKLRNIKIKLVSGKGHGKYRGIMHMKLFIVDDITVGFGSANYTYSAFYKNYELLYINDDWTFTRRFIKVFDELWSNKRR
jgi:phosphatidylserine/phosphatidylglycerophosphate/cardiolipin synthase-like enzyme